MNDVLKVLALACLLLSQMETDKPGETVESFRDDSNLRGVLDTTPTNSHRQ